MELEGDIAIARTIGELSKQILVLRYLSLSRTLIYFLYLPFLFSFLALHCIKFDLCPPAFSPLSASFPFPISTHLPFPSFA